MFEKFHRGDIYSADLSPGIGSEQSGSRPVLILQNNVGNCFSPTIIIAAITSVSKKSRKFPTHYHLNDRCGLVKPSVVMLEQIRTIDKSRLKNYIGHLNKDARLRRDAIKQQAITLENIYKIMVNFDCVYNIINDEEKRNVVTALIKEIEIYRNDESEYPLKRIGLNFPVFKDGGEVTELLWDKGNTVEAIVSLQREI